MTMPTKEQAMEYALATWEVVKANVLALSDAGLFKLDYVMAFSKDLILPFEKENMSVPKVQSLLLAKVDDLKKGFIVMNAVTFFLEVLGNLMAFLLGRGMFLFGFDLLYAFAVAYVLYWLVICASGNDYQLVAIGLYVIYSMINIIQAVVTLPLIIPPLFFFAKTIASLCCAYYAFKIEKMTGFTALKEEGVELGVAE